jgi:hypothetical protein
MENSRRSFIRKSIAAGVGMAGLAATNRFTAQNTNMETTPSKSLVIVYSCHHKNTEKVARMMANVLKAEIKHPQDINVEEISGYDLVGFGAGIDGGKHYEPVLKLAEEFAKKLIDYK